MSQTLSVQWGGRTIEFALVGTDSKRLSITVHPDQRVVVRAPAGSSPEMVACKVKRRAPWIVKQLQYFEQFLPPVPERRYISGETHRYLGRQYRLKVEPGSEADAKLKGKFLHVTVPEPARREMVREAVQAWYGARCRELFARRIDVCLRRASFLNLAPPRLVLRKMKTRWASYGASGAILLNPELIKVSVACIDYVIIHEFCHAREPNHSSRFYRLLSRALPDWQCYRERLDRTRLD